MYLEPSEQSQSIHLILGRSICALFSDAQLVHSASKGGVFFYDVYLPQKVLPEFMAPLQEEMHRLLDQGVDYYPLEMIPSNAKELFEHHGQWVRANQLKVEKAPLVHLVKFDEHYDFAQSPSHFEGAFKLTHIEEKSLEVDGEKLPISRIYGLYASDKKELKKRVQAQKEISKYDHGKLGEDLNLFFQEEQHWFFTPKGTEILSKFQNKFERLFQSFGFQKVELLPKTQIAFSKLFVKLSKAQPKPLRLFSKLLTQVDFNPFFKGLYAREQEEGYSFKILCESPQEVTRECIYCLKFYLEIIKILGFSCEIEYDPQKRDFSLDQFLEQEALKVTSKTGLKGLQLRVFDHWKRNLFDLALKKSELKGQPLLEGKLPSLERLLAWSLEDQKGNLSKEFCAPAVHILLLEGAKEYANEVSQYFKKNEVHVSIDETKDKLETKLYGALKRRQSNIVIIGAQEAKAQKLTLRRASSAKQSLLTKEELLEELRTT